jgi:hypothetical protein
MNLVSKPRRVLMAAAKLTVVLDQRDDKKNSVKFSTEADSDAGNNHYIPNAGVEKLGNPKKVKVTIEAA